ncbi:LppP/LprE family lipoprotein [Gordonia neofelifaecis]|uniref:LppP/LprE family lipoprotein n=1 Tax=Gordonia neofelifaecis NRRL B-59395 TaxID=644548 RepID=F1YLG5_9ACTN|nr:LppP/LprE family lipoprotein [Gordonia neofelifaecis]EGD54359.1 hypothetical protein SCNU_13784 [Gordonia neofelifaecis NRRL B-59395]
MRIGDSARVLAAMAVVGLLLGACSTSEGDPVAEQSTTATRGRPSATVPPRPDDTAPPAETAPAEVTAVEPGGPDAGAPRTAPASNTEAPRPGSGHGLCFDLNSKLAADAIATLGADSNGGSWQPYRASNHPLSDGCGLDWMQVNGSGFNDATYTSRVLLFAAGEFLGTVEPHEYSYTSIAGDTLDSVTVRYRWLRPDDPFCCPQGGPTDVTATLSGGAVVRSGQFPPAT